MSLANRHGSPERLHSVVAEHSLSFRQLNLVHRSEHDQRVVVSGLRIEVGVPERVCVLLRQPRQPRTVRHVRPADTDGGAQVHARAHHCTRREAFHDGVHVEVMPHADLFGNGLVAFFEAFTESIDPRTARTGQPGEFVLIPLLQRSTGCVRPERYPRLGRGRHRLEALARCQQAELLADRVHALEEFAVGSLLDACQSPGGASHASELNSLHDINQRRRRVQRTPSD